MPCVSAALQQAWLILSRNRWCVNDRGDFKLTFQSVFRSVLRIWLPLHDRSAGLSMCSPAAFTNKRNSPKLLSKVRSAMRNDMGSCVYFAVGIFTVIIDLLFWLVFLQ